MHGIIFSELKKYAKTFDLEWESLQKEAGISFKHYLPIKEYPDDEIYSLIKIISQKNNVESSELLENFGEYLAPTLYEMYKPLINPEWKTLDVLENVEETIHSVVRLQKPGAHPPSLVCHRESPEEVVTLSEDSCMLKGHTSCRITVRISSLFS